VASEAVVVTKEGGGDGAQRPSNQSPERVLVVDDDQLLARGLAATLARVGYDVVVATGGEEAMGFVNARSFDVIVSDIAMPGMGGLELLKAIRSRDLDVPVILMTGVPDVATATRAIEHGVFRYMVKPVQIPELREIMSQATKMHALARLRRQALSAAEDNGMRNLNDRAALEARFEMALQSLWIATQPIVSWDPRSLFGYESLVRNNEPSLRSPLALFDTAERLQRLPDLSRRIRVHIAALMPTAPPLVSMFVNLHPMDLLDEEDLFSPEAPLTPWAARIVLEVTERAKLEAIPEVSARIAKLRDLGYRIALDDMGAGYAGLSSFVILEPEVVKLDMELIRDIDTRMMNRTVVEGLVGVCRNLKLDVVAEGVEKPSERDCLVDIGCNLLQGYLFAKPGADFPAPDL
jgi:EAL domain-containing protein (putative c-di-GMP-specific phosphodiesterase class I)